VFHERSVCNANGTYKGLGSVIFAGRAKTRAQRLGSNRRLHVRPQHAPSSGAPPGSDRAITGRFGAGGRFFCKGRRLYPSCNARRERKPGKTREKTGDVSRYSP
jgi:hypothetical protein